MHTPTRFRPVITLFAALALSLSLTACGGDSPAPSDGEPGIGQNEPGNSNGAGTEPGNSAELPEALSGFPVPAEYSVRTAGSQGGATTAMLYNIPGDWQEIKTFYETELAKAGWELVGDRTFGNNDGTELDATKNDAQATIAISSNGNKTSITINLIEP